MNEQMKILIGYDGSECADAALDDLSRAGLPEELEAVVLTVSEVWVPDLAEVDAPDAEFEIHEVPTAVQSRGAAAMAEATRLAGVAEARLKKRFPKWTVRTQVAADSPAWGLLKLADEIQPDLIVVGSHGRSALGRLFIGSVSQKVLTEARGSVRIARGDVPVPGAPARIVIGVDGMPDSMAAVEEVASRNWPAGTAVEVVAAFGPLDIALVPPLGLDVPLTVADGVVTLHTTLEKGVKEAIERLQSRGLLVTGGVREMAPIPAILDAAKTWGADTIFIGARGHRFMERFLLGSVSSAVATRAHCSVEVTRRR